MDGYIKHFVGERQDVSTIENIFDFLEFVLPVGFAKLYIKANKRWDFLEKKRRKKVIDMFMCNELSKFGINVWDIRTSRGYAMEKHHTVPIINILGTMIKEFAVQKGFCAEESTVDMALMKLAGTGLIVKEKRDIIDFLFKFRSEVLDGGANKELGIHDGPMHYEEAVECLLYVEKVFSGFGSRG